MDKKDILTEEVSDWDVKSVIGKTVLIIGKTASGKTTLAKELLKVVCSPTRHTIVFTANIYCGLEYTNAGVHKDQVHVCDTPKEAEGILKQTVSTVDKPLVVVFDDFHDTNRFKDCKTASALIRGNIPNATVIFTSASTDYKRDIPNVGDYHFYTSPSSEQFAKILYIKSMKKFYRIENSS